MEAAVADDRDAGRLGGERGLVDRGHLRDADAGDDAGGADGAGSDADLDAVAAGVDQRLGAVAGGDVAADDVDGGVRLDLGDHVADQAGVTVGGVDDDEVGARLDQGLGALVRVTGDADGRTDEEPAVLVLGGVRVLLGLDEVLDRDEALEDARVVDQRKLLDLVAAQQLHGVHARDADLARDQRHRGHDLAHLAAAVRLEGHVAVGDDAEELAGGVGDRDAGDAELRAKLVGLAQRRVRVHRDRVGDHAGLGALDQVDLVGLVGDGEVAVQHADAALTGHGDGHAGLGDLVHGGGQQRNVHTDVPRDQGRGVDRIRRHVRRARQQQHVVVGQSERGEFVGHSVGGHDTFPNGLAQRGCPC